MFQKDIILWQLDQFDLGTSTAENDPLLEIAKIETQEFHDLYFHDRIDIVRGIKGSGKTALYRLLYLLRNNMVEKKSLYCVFGIEAQGDPIFRQFQPEFDSYGEIEFENFWGIYLIVLVYKLIFTTQSFRKHLNEDDINEIDSTLAKMGIKISKDDFTLKDVTCSIFEYIRKCKIQLGLETKVHPGTAYITAFKPTLELDPTNIGEITKKPIYLADFKNTIVSMLEKYGLKIWVMLDRLDEVFLHRSATEYNGLRGLLKAAYNFSNPCLRVKIFLREDIIDYLASKGFTALTHVIDRCSNPMSWSKDDILYLIVKRISANRHLKDYYKLDDEKIDHDKTYREEVFYIFFPRTIGKKPTLDWLYSNCADGNNIVTPRDIIDFFKFAKAEQFKKFKLNPQDQEVLITEDIFEIALDKLSDHKKTTYLFAEFNHLKTHILKFDSGHAEYKGESLHKLFGDNWQKIVEELKAVGLLKYIPKSATYRIPVIWRKGLNIKRTRTFNS